MPARTWNWPSPVLRKCGAAGFNKRSLRIAPMFNVEEPPGKVVGKVRQCPPGEILERMVARFHAIGLKLPFPKGVYRFKTFEEADAWEMKHRIAAAVKRLRDHQH